MPSGVGLVQRSSTFNDSGELARIGGDGGARDRRSLDRSIVPASGCFGSRALQSDRDAHHFFCILAGYSPGPAKTQFWTVARLALASASARWFTERQPGIAFPPCHLPCVYRAASPSR